MTVAARRPAHRTSPNGAPSTVPPSLLGSASRVNTPPAPETHAAPPNATPASTLDEFAGDPNFMTSLARGLLVIQSFSPQTPRMTISQLSVKTGLSRAAVRRCLYTLSKLGFAGVEDGSRYALRPRMLTLSNTYSASNSLSTAAQPILERMSAELHESFSVATLDGDDIVYIARSSVSRVMSDELHIGSRLPAYCTSMGRVLLAYTARRAVGAVSGPRGADPAYPAHSKQHREASPRAAQRSPPWLRAGRSGVRDRPALARSACLLAHRARRCDPEPERKRAAHAAYTKCRRGFCRTCAPPPLNWARFSASSAKAAASPRQMFPVAPMVRPSWCHSFVPSPAERCVHGECNRLASILVLEAPTHAVRRCCTRQRTWRSAFARAGACPGQLLFHLAKHAGHRYRRSPSHRR